MKSRIFATVTYIRLAIVAFSVVSWPLDGEDEVVIVNDTDTLAVSEVLGRGVGCREGTRDGRPVGVSVGTLVGWRVGIAVGTNVGTGVGGFVYSTTITDVVTVADAVAFLLAVMLTPVMFALAAASAVDRFPLDAADEMSDRNELVRFAELPPYSVPRRRPPPPSLVRATTPSRRTSSVKCTSTLITVPAAFETFSARIDLT